MEAAMSVDDHGATTAPQPLGWGRVTAALVLGATVAVALGVLGRVLTPDYRPLDGFGFSDNLTFKTWLASGVLVLAAGQLLTALWMFGRLPSVRGVPSRLAGVHRSLGVTTFLLTLPVAFCCLYAYGFAPSPMTARTLTHSVLGCLFYGAFGIKVLAVRHRRSPAWALPVVGGTLVALVVLLWMTSALWFFQTTGVHR
jgi:hypothetical protein